MISITIGLILVNWMVWDHKKVMAELAETTGRFNQTVE